MAKVYRVFVEKKKGNDIEAGQILEDLRSNVGITALKDLRIINRYDAEGLSEEEAAYTAKRGTRDRKSYHNYYCSEKWGDSRLYDMCINTSKIGLEKAADVMELYVHRRMAGM